MDNVAQNWMCRTPSSGSVLLVIQHDGTIATDVGLWPQKVHQAVGLTRVLFPYATSLEDFAACQSELPRGGLHAVLHQVGNHPYGYSPFQGLDR